MLVAGFADKDEVKCAICVWFSVTAVDPQTMESQDYRFNSLLIPLQTLKVIECPQPKIFIIDLPEEDDIPDDS